MRNPELVDVAALLLRLALAAMFFAHAWLKIRVFTIPGTVKYFASLGVPGVLAYFTIAAEIGGGLLLLFGIGTRWGGLAFVPLILGTIGLVYGRERGAFFKKVGGRGKSGLCVRGLVGVG